MEMSVNIKHSHPRSLLHTETRHQFLEEFVYLLRYIADGRANIGQLRRPGGVIHRSVGVLPLGSIEERVTQAPQMALDDVELERWLHEEGKKFSA